MKKLFIAVSLLISMIAGTMVLTSFSEPDDLGKDMVYMEMSSLSAPNLDCISFRSDDGATLDFYSDKVIYCAKGSNISRRGDYSVSSKENIGHEGKYPMSVMIYVGERTVKMEGICHYNQSQRRVDYLILNRQRWNRI